MAKPSGDERPTEPGKLVTTVHDPRGDQITVSAAHYKVTEAFGLLDGADILILVLAPIAAVVAIWFAAQKVRYRATPWYVTHNARKVRGHFRPLARYATRAEAVDAVAWLADAVRREGAAAAVAHMSVVHRDRHEPGSR